MSTNESKSHRVEVAQGRGCVCYREQIWNEGDIQALGAEKISITATDARHGSAGFGACPAEYQIYFGLIFPYYVISIHPF